MDMYKFFKALVLILICINYLLEQNLVTSQRDSGRGRRPQRNRNEDLHREIYESIQATCTYEQNYMCKFDPRVKELQIPTCIPLESVCDGTPQCPMQDDELECPETCGKYELRCSDGKTCATVCNEIPECPSLEDEIFCAPVCRDGHLRCPDGACARVCDGVPDCKSGADERNCGVQCEIGEVYCSDMATCALVCDGIQQCNDGADEQHCLPQCPLNTDIICPSGQCGKTCDGRPDCTADKVYGVTPDELNCRKD